MPQQQGKFTVADVGQFKPEDIDQTAPVKPQVPVEQPKSGFATVGDAFKSQLRRTLGETGTDLLIGGGKGVTSTLLGVTQMANRGGFMPNIPNEAFDVAQERYTTPANATQAFGKGAEQVGEFFLPSGEVTRAAALAGKLPKAAQWLVRGGLEGAAAAGVHTLQTGSPEGAPGVGMTGAITGAAGPMVGKGLSFLGERVERALVKASQRDINNGFKVGNIFKHQLGGSLQDTFKKSESKLDELGTAYRAELSRPLSTGVVPEVDVLQAMTDVAQDFAKNPSRTFGKNVNINGAIEKLIDDPAFQALKSGKADLLTANELKRAVGELGAWLDGERDPEANAMEMVANALYSKLRAGIENAAASGPEKIRALNRQMGEIIPIRQAVIRRIPVEQRQNVLNIGDLIGFSTGSIGVAMMNRLLKSGQFANVASKTGEAVTNKTGAGLFGGGVSSQVIR